MDTVTTCLVGLIVLCSIFQPNNERRIPALFLAGAMLAHEWLLSYQSVEVTTLNGIAYYGSAIIFSLAVIAITSNLATVTPIIRCIHKVCLAAICINCIGGVMFIYGMLPYLYPGLMALLNLVTILILITKDENYGRPSAYSHMVGLFRHRHSGGSGIHGSP